MCGGAHHTKTMNFKVCQRMAVRSLKFVGWHITEIFLVPPKDRYRHYESVPTFWRILKSPCFWCVLSSPMFAFDSSAF